MHAAHLVNSQRLKRVHDYLADGQERTTLDIIEATRVCAVNSVVAELRANGCVVRCERRGDVWFYRMVYSPIGRAQRSN